MSSGPGATASDYFGGMAATYDSLVRRAVPRYEEMTARLLEYFPPSAGRVLELGSGTGNLTLRLAARYPRAALTVVDAAPEMIALARARLEAAQPETARAARFVEARFEELELPAGGFDLVTSCISLHHVADKAALYRRIHRALAPGGTFRFADQLAGGTAANHAVNWERWLEFCRQGGNLTGEELQSLLDHAAAHDHYTPVRDHFRWLEEAGFRDCDCVWRNWIWGIVTAEW